MQPLIRSLEWLLKNGAHGTRSYLLHGAKIQLSWCFVMNSQGSVEDGTGGSEALGALDVHCYFCGNQQEESVIINLRGSDLSAPNEL